MTCREGSPYVCLRYSLSLFPADDYTLCSSCVVNECASVVDSFDRTDGADSGGESAESVRERAHLSRQQHLGQLGRGKAQTFQCFIL